MSLLLGKAMTSLGSLFSPLGTTASLKHMFEKCVNARTRKEEEWLIEDCLKVVKSRLKDPTTTPSMVTRGLAFVIFADLLGYKSEFAQIYAVKLAQHGTLVEKKIGYLSCVFLMRSSDPLAVMVMNTILRDLGSKNILIVAMAASASCYLIPTNLASTVLPLLAEKLNHQSVYLRSKAVVVFHHFLRLCPEYCCHYLESVSALLGDKDPCVVGHVLNFLVDVAKVNNTLFIKLVPHLISIQHQILSGKLPHSFNYQGLSAPWMQFTLLRLLQCSEELKTEIAEICHKTLETLKTNEKLFLKEALKIECLNALIHTEGGEENLNLAMKYTEELLSSNSSNLRYAGLDLLQSVIQHYQITLTSEQQDIILKCLEHVDSTVKRKTLRLLCVAATEKNVDMICSLVADNARLCCENNLYFQAELVKEAIVLTDKFPSNNNYWHIAMLIRLLPLADETQTKLIQQRIKSGLSSENEQNIGQARHKVLQILRKYSGSKKASTSILEMYVWTLSHFGVVRGSDDDSTSNQIIQEIVQLGRKILKHQVKANLPPEIERLLVSIHDALTYIIYNYGVKTGVVEYVEEVKSMTVNNSYLHKYCQEIIQSLPHSQELQSCLKHVNWCKETEGFDFTLSFLDWYVCESLRNGEKLYHPKHLKIVDMNGSVSVMDSECFLYPSINTIRDSPAVCTSPVSSEKESCFGSFSSEELKFTSMKSSGKEIVEPKIVWTKTGRLEDENVDSAVEDVQQVPLEDNSKSSQDNSGNLFEKKDDNSKEKNVDENQDPLEKLLSQDFQKLYVNNEKD